MILKSRIKELYSNIELAVYKIKTNSIQKNLVELKDCLNEFFNEAQCLGIIYTENQDKLFFGTYIMPYIEADQVIKIITSDSKYIVNKYYVELDSKLFSEQFGLDYQEIAALIIHDVGALVNNSSPSEIVAKEIDKYLVEHNDSLKLSPVIHYKELLSYGFRDALRKITSIFELGKYERKDDTLAEFIDWTDYSGHIITGLTKLDRQGQLFFNRQIQNKFLVLAWVLRIYKNVIGYRTSVNRLVDRLKTMSPSKLEIKELTDFCSRVNRIDEDMLLEDTDIELLENIRSNKFSNIYSESNCNKQMMDELLDNMLKINDIDDNPSLESMEDMIHNINNSMNLVKDFKDSFITDKNDKKQWDKIYKELNKQRNIIYNKATFFDKNIKYNNIWNNNCGGR